jgi:hypothetical protein
MYVWAVSVFCQLSLRMVAVSSHLADPRSGRQACWEALFGDGSVCVDRRRWSIVEVVAHAASIMKPRTCNADAAVAKSYTGNQSFKVSQILVGSLPG